MAGSTNKMRWDMDCIFPGGAASPEFAAFRDTLTQDIDKVGREIEDLPKKLDGTSFEAWIKLLLLFQDVYKRFVHADHYAFCLTAQDVNDERAMVILEEMSSKEAALEAIRTGIEDLAIAVGDDAWQKLVSDRRLVGSAFFWDELRRNASLKMEPRLEKLAAELAVNGYHAWNRLYTKMAGDLRAEFEEEGKTENLSMGQLANRMSSPDREVRRRAFEALETSWRKTEALAAMELNSLAGFRLSLYKQRGWESPLFETYLMGRVQEKTIEAMWKAVAVGLKAMKDYVAAKKRILSIDAFRWYDQGAPLGEVEKKYEYGEAADFVVKHLTSFSTELGEFARKAIDDRWIEAEDRTGKAGGGFCAGFPVIQQSRIFMTFSGNYNEMMTLAHELGHAYHSWVLRDRDYFARFYPMGLAETASTFNEMLVTDAALEAADSEAEKVSLLDKKIQEHLAMFCNIRARFIFESAFHNERRKGSLPKERLSELMVEAQKEAFGDILAEDGYHPLFWCSKMHFSETGVPFYNWPYTFGHLFAGGIYDRAKREGPGFEERYRALLADTGSMVCEDVARKHLDVDLSGPEFWDDAVGRACRDVESFLGLV
jgi:pepF/M3 family oligoendopeptidase